MRTTRVSLLLRIKDYDNVEAWNEFHALYAPLLFRYARSRGLAPSDAEEMRDRCLMAVARKISSFDYDRTKGRFKNWLFRIAHGHAVDIIRKKRERHADTQCLANLRDSAPSPDEEWEQHWKHEHLRYCVEQIRAHVSEEYYRAFRMLLFDNLTVVQVCERMNMNPNQVYKAKSRVLARIREKMAELDPHGIL